VFQGTVTTFRRWGAQICNLLVKFLQMLCTRNY